MVLFKRKALSKSKIVLSEIYSHVYAIYLKISKHKTIPLALDLFTYLQNYHKNYSYARLRDVINALFAIEI